MNGKFLLRSEKFFVAILVNGMLCDNTTNISQYILTIIMAFHCMYIQCKTLSVFSSIDIQPYNICIHIPRILRISHQNRIIEVNEIKMGKDAENCAVRSNLTHSAAQIPFRRLKSQKSS